MRVCKADMVILELAVHDRFDSRTYDAVKKKDAMNTAIAITPITAPNHIPIRDARLRRGVADLGTSAGDAENSDSMEITRSVEILACDA